MQLLFAIPLLCLLLGQPHTAYTYESYHTCYIPDKRHKGIGEIAENGIKNIQEAHPFAIFSNEVIRKNLKAALKAWAFVQPGDVLREISAHAPEAVQGNSTFNTIVKLLEKGNVGENQNLMYALKNAFVQQADRFLTFYIQEYPSDLLKVLKNEPKEPFLKVLSASSPHFFLRNFVRTYELKSDDNVEDGSLGDNFIKYFVDRHPGESMELTMEKNDNKRNEMWLEEVRKISLDGSIKNVEDLKKYSKAITDKNDVIFQALRSKLIEAIKEGRENFFTYFVLLIKLGNLKFGNILVEAIANFHPNDYLKSLISYEPLSFRTALLKTYHVELEVAERSSPSDFYHMKPAVQRFFKDLIEADVAAFKDVVKAVDNKAKDLDELFQKNPEEFLKWMRKNIVKFTEKYVELHHKVLCKFYNESRNLQLSKRLVEKEPKFFTTYIDSLEAKSKRFFLETLVSELTDNQLKRLIYTNKTLFEESLKKRKFPDGWSLYQEKFQKLGPRKFAQLFNVTYYNYNETQYRYIGVYSSIFSEKAEEFIRASMRTLPDQFARALVDFKPSLGCTFAKEYTKDFANSILSLLLTPADELIDHMIIKHKLELVKTLLAVEVFDGFSFVNEFTKWRQQYTENAKRPHYFFRAILQEGGVHWNLFRDSFVELYVMRHPKIVFKYIFEMYPFIIDGFLDDFAFQKLLRRISQGHPEVFLKHSLRNKVGDYTGVATYREGAYRYEIEIKDEVKKAKAIVKEVLRRDRGVFLDVFFKEFNFDQYMPLLNTFDETRRNLAESHGR